jgi:hypothetical protein
MADDSTARYLNENVGPVLAKALAEMSISQPTDGVHFLSQWLKTYADQEEEKAVQEAEEKALAEERGKTQRRLQERLDQKEAIAKIQRSKEEAYAKLKEAFASEQFQEEFWSRLVEVSKESSGAQAVYLGLNDADGITLADKAEPTGPCIRYTKAVGSPSPDATGDLMETKVLLPEQGVTWAVFEENPPDEAIAEKFLFREGLEIPPEPPAEGEAAEDAPSAEPVPPKYPSYLPVVVDTVTDNSKIHYFDMTRLGAYMAVPMVYRSFFQQAALDQAKQFETERRAEVIRKREEAEAAAAEAAAAAAEAGQAEPQEPIPVAKGDENAEAAAPAAEAEPVVEEKEPEPDLQANGVDVKMVLCLDTLRTNTKFDTPKTVLEMFELCQACGGCKSRDEKRQVIAQAKEMLDLAAQEEEPPPEAEAEDPARKEELDKDLAEIEDEASKALRTALHEKQTEYARALQLLLSQKEALKKIRNWMIVKPEVVNIVAAVALLFGFPKDALYPPRKAKLDWEFLRSTLDDPLFEAIQKAPVMPVWVRKAISDAQKLSAIQPLVPTDYSTDKAKEDAPALASLWSFLEAAIALRKADLQWRQDRFEFEKKQALEAETPFEKDLTKEDDDFPIE